MVCRWKLHLSPEGAQSGLPPLPPHKTAVEVLADYLRYLHECARRYISDVHGANLWADLEADIPYILTHPNGWHGLPQAKMREAAIIARLIPDTEAGRSRISFVTEGEASLHFCLSNGMSVEVCVIGTHCVPSR